MRARASGLRTRYGLSPEQFQAMLDERQGRCDICGEADPVRRLCVDHDHACCPGEKTCGACIRGLLCNRCNRLIGHAQDDPTLLTAAVAYVTRS